MININIISTQRATLRPSSGRFGPLGAPPGGRGPNWGPSGAWCWFYYTTQKKIRAALQGAPCKVPCKAPIQAALQGAHASRLARRPYKAHAKRLARRHANRLPPSSSWRRCTVSWRRSSVWPLEGAHQNDLKSGCDLQRHYNTYRCMEQAIHGFNPKAWRNHTP